MPSSGDCEAIIMLMKDKLQFVQFLHPGSEPKLSSIEKAKLHKDWNISGDHFRKFMETDGDYLNTKGKLCKGTLRFWGEWEPDSGVKKLITFSYPHWLHYPVLIPGRVSAIHSSCGSIGACRGVCAGGLQNTDPFVFNNPFLYSICQQFSGTVPTQIAALSIGSIIVFGSCVNKCFAVDTVFVVGSRIPYYSNSAQKDLKGHISKDYVYIQQSIFGTSTHGTPPQISLYKGATLSNSVEGMYSFVPCRISDNSDIAFERPILDTKAVARLKSICSKSLITPTLTQSRKATDISNLASMKEIWTELRNIIIEQDYIEGVSFRYK